MSTNLTGGHTSVVGLKIAYLEQGSGSALMLIHGIPTNNQMWRAIIPEFEPLQRPEAEAEMSLKASITMMRGFMPTGLVNKSVMTDEVGAYLNTFLSQTHSNRRGGGQVRRI